MMSSSNKKKAPYTSSTKGKSSGQYDQRNSQNLGVEPPAVVAQSKEDDPTTTVDPKAISDPSLLLEQRLETMLVDMRELREQMESFKTRAETAESERDSDRKILAEMIKRVRADKTQRSSSTERARSSPKSDTRSHDPDASGRVSVGTTDSSPFNLPDLQRQRHNPSALSEALDAANDAIRELQEANEQLKLLLNESNKERRFLREEKNDLINEVDIRGKELDDEKRAYDLWRRETSEAKATQVQDQLEVKIQEVKRLEDLLHSEEEKNDQLEEKYRLLKRGGSSAESEDDEYKRAYEEKAQEVELLRNRLAERDDLIRLDEDRIAEKNQLLRDKTTKISYFKDYLRSHGFRVEDGDETSGQMNEGDDIGHMPEQLEQQASKAEEMRSDSASAQRALREINAVIVGVSNGDLARKLIIQPKERDLDMATLKSSVNDMVDKLRTIALEVYRVARETGAEGKLGGQAHVPDANGSWRVMVDNVNDMAMYLTTQVREVNNYIGAVGRGDFDRMMQVQLESRGEIRAMYETAIHAIDTLTKVVNAVIELTSDATRKGLYGGLVDVDLEGLGGKWRRLANNTNSVVHLLRVQRRAASDIANKVMQGDATPLNVEPSYPGETREMFLALNKMLDDLRDNWTRGTEAGEAGTAGHDQKVQEEKLQRIWTLLHSNI